MMTITLMELKIKQHYIEGDSFCNIKHEVWLSLETLKRATFEIEYPYLVITIIIYTYIDNAVKICDIKKSN